MPTTLLSKFTTGNLNTSSPYDYTLESADGELPDGFTFGSGNSNNSIGTTDSGEPSLDHNSGGRLRSTDSDIATVVPSNAFRALFVFEFNTIYNGYEFIKIDDGSDDNQLFLETTSSNFRVSMMADAASLCEWYLGSVLSTGTTYALEVRYDEDETTHDDWLKCRLWEVGETIPSLTAGSAAGSDSASAADFTRIDSDPGNGGFHEWERLIVDSDTDEDLSGYTTTYPGGSIIPQIMHHRRMLEQ